MRKKDENQVIRITPPKDANEDNEMLTQENFDKICESILSKFNIDPLAERISEKSAKTSEDFLELAKSANSSKSALKYAKKALELDPENLDASVMVAEASASSPDKLLDKYKKLIGEAEKKLESEGYFDENCVGEFWLILETRPYMRLLMNYVETLVECCKMRCAAEVCEKMLRLCNMDNLGARYRIMHIYAYLEEEQAALKILEKYPVDDTQMLLPMSIMYYKLGDLKESVKYLKKLRTLNKDTIEFFENIAENDFEQLLYSMNPFGYRPDTIEELMAEGSENAFLFGAAVTYFDWALSKLKTMK